MSQFTLSQNKRLRYTTFFYLYFMQGIPAGFALTALANYLASTGASAAQVGGFTGLVGLPWTLQLVWGPLIDRYQYSVVGHRKHWVLLTQLIAFAASLLLLLVENPAKEIGLLTTLFFTHSVFASIQDASVDAMAISIVPTTERGRLNAFMRGGFLMGISFGAGGLSWVLHQYSFKTAVVIQSSLLLFFTLLFFITRIQREDVLLPRFFQKSVRDPNVHSANPTLRSLFRQLWIGVSEAQSLRLFLFLALGYFCFSVFIRSFSFHMISVLHWPDQELSVLQGSWGSLLTFFIIIAGGSLADKLGAQKLLRFVLILLSAYLILFNLSSPWWANKPFVTSGILFWSLADPLYSVAAFPLLMLLCSSQVAGSQFTTYMALINLCDVLGSYFSGWALSWTSAPTIGVACGFVLLGVWIAVRRGKEVQELAHA